jgi:hypothetical protein
MCCVGVAGSRGGAKVRVSASSTLEADGAGTGWPHRRQNLAPAVISAPHFGQLMLDIDVAIDRSSMLL